jgi:hypothetical protein
VPPFDSAPPEPDGTPPLLGAPLIPEPPEPSVLLAPTPVLPLMPTVPPVAPFVSVLLSLALHASNTPDESAVRTTNAGGPRLVTRFVPIANAKVTQKLLNHKQLAILKLCESPCDLVTRKQGQT